MRLKSITATLLVSAWLLSLLVASPRALAADEIQLKDNRPQSYTVQKGDTLWGISSKFLKDPWRWPEIWRMNRDQVKNPHWIYPGDVVSLNQVNGQWQLSVERPTQRLSPTVRIDQLADQAIPSIPTGDLAPYLSQPTVTGKDGLPGGASIIAGGDNRVVRGDNDYVYGVNVDEKAGTQWFIYRSGKVLHSLDTNEILGYEMKFLGTARVDRFGEVSRMQITSAKEEILIGDQLVPAPREELINYVPHPPDASLDGRIISLYGETDEAGRGFIVTLDRGLRDGVEVGHVMAIYHPLPVIVDPRPNAGGDVFATFTDQTKILPAPTRYLNIPPERTGLLFVFRVFDKVSYAIVLNASDPVVVGDLVRKP
jgi:LysM domain